METCRGLDRIETITRRGNPVTGAVKGHDQTDGKNERVKGGRWARLADVTNRVGELNVLNHLICRVYPVGCCGGGSAIVSSHSASDASGLGSVSGRFDSKYVTRTLDADLVASLLLLAQK